SRSVIVDLIRPAYRLMRLNSLTSVCIEDHKFPGIDHVPSSQPAAHKQAMMRGVQTRGVGLRPTGDGPLGYHSAFVGVDDLDDAVTVHDISHANVEPVCCTVEDDSCRIGAIHLDAAHQFGRLGIDNLDCVIFISLPCNDANVVQALDGIIRGVIRIPMRRAFSARQLDGLSYLECGSADCNSSVVSEVDPKFITAR